jgi:MFS family permease
MLLMVAGTLLYMVGLTMYGIVAIYVLFIAAMVLITFGEMIVTPVGQTLTANFAPVDKRGRYMALFGLSWTIAAAIGPWGAGIIMDNYNPDWVWYLSGITAAVAAAGFFALYVATKDRLVMAEEDAQSATGA